MGQLHVAHRVPVTKHPPEYVSQSTNIVYVLVSRCHFLHDVSFHRAQSHSRATATKHNTLRVSASRTHFQPGRRSVIEIDGVWSGTSSHRQVTATFVQPR